MSNDIFNNIIDVPQRDISRGDIIAVERKKGKHKYQHFAVYIGNYEVIHYAADNSDFGLKISIHKAPFDDFIKDSARYCVLDFDSINKTYTQYKARVPLKPGSPFGKSSFIKGNGAFVYFSIIPSTMKLINEMVKILNSEDYHLYSAEETVKRAESKLGETKYNLAFNNCEHFAIWCKTGLHESKQVEKILKVLCWRGGVFLA